MIESLVNPKRDVKGEWKMFFVGLLYASLSILIVRFFFKGDTILYEYGGMLVVTFCVMFALPFMYFIIKREEKEDEETEGFFHVWHAHSDALYAFMWLFLGFVVAFAFWNIALQDTSLFNAQLETYCAINKPADIENCISNLGLYEKSGTMVTSASGKLIRFVSILENNVYVMIFTLIFSLIFGAGAIFILAWNASVIAAAIGIFTKYKISEIPLGLARYMIHGFPEIAAYFLTALAGGILGVGIVRNGFKNKRFLKVLENVIILLFISLIILIFAGLIEVYLTPLFF